MTVAVNRRTLAGTGLLLPLWAALGRSTLLTAPALAQDTMGTPEPVAKPSRIMFAAELAELPPPPAFVRLVRIVLQPGAAVPMHSHPGPEIGVVEHGSLTVETGGAVAVNSVSGNAVEIPESGATFQLSPGDQVVYPAGTPFGFRNEGDRPAAVLAVVVLPAGAGRPPGSEWVNGAPGADAMEGVSSIVLGDAAAPGWPSAPLTLQIDSLQLDPGVPIPGWPGPVMIAVEEGQIGFTLIDGEYQMSGNGNEPKAFSGAGEQQLVATGEAVFLPGGMNEVPRDAQQGSASVIRLGISGRNAPPAGAPATPPPDMAADATPVAASLAGGREVVTIEDGVRLRENPSTTADVVLELSAGEVLVVTGDAVEADGFAWFPVELATDSGTSGYIAEPGLAPAP